MTNVIGVSGKQGSGKTTLCRALEHWLRDKFGADVRRVRFAHFIYEMHDRCRDILAEYKEDLESMDIHYPFDKKDGDLLQLLGTEWGRKVDENIWAALTKAKIDRELAARHAGVQMFILIEDMRFENEFNMLPEGLKVRLEASEENRKGRAEMWRENTTHPSEVGLDQYAEDGKFDLYYRSDKDTADEIAKDIIDYLESN